MNTENYKAAAEGRLGADRMALGLSIIPDKNRGDMDEVLRLRSAIQRAETSFGILYRTLSNNASNTETSN
jgi:hypothetical protein